MFALQPRGITGIYTKVVDHRVFTKPSETAASPTVDFFSIDCILVGWMTNNIFFFLRKSSPLEHSVLYSLEEMRCYYVWSEVLFHIHLAINLGSLEMKQYSCAWESSSSYDSYSFYLAQRRKQSWSGLWVSQSRCRNTFWQLFLLLGYKELLLYWLLLFIVGKWLPFPLLSFCFLLFLGLFVLRFFLLSKHALLYHKRLHFAGCI